MFFIESEVDGTTLVTFDLFTAISVSDFVEVFFEASFTGASFWGAITEPAGTIGFRGLMMEFSEPVTLFAIAGFVLVIGFDVGSEPYDFGLDVVDCPLLLAYITFSQSFVLVSPSDGLKSLMVSLPGPQSK
jgi:hypothetical protein